MYGSLDLRWLLTASIAWFLGVAIFIVASIAWNGYEGFPDIVILPVCGGIVSAGFVGVGLLVGLPLRWTFLGRAWRSSSRWAVTMALGGALILAFGSVGGITGEFTHPDTGVHFHAIHPAAALGGYALLLFAVAHWPRVSCC